MFKQYWWLIFLILGACTGVPEGVTPVNNVDTNRYLGTWYEIARLDHSFERGLEKVTAHYALRDDGGISVINQGYNPKKQTWKKAEGKAYFIDPTNPDQTHTGRLKVSFFGPFYSSYNIIDLDLINYQYALITGPDKSYLWILSRTPHLDPLVLENLVNEASALDFPTNELIYVNQ